MSDKKEKKAKRDRAKLMGNAFKTKMVELTQ